MRDLTDRLALPARWLLVAAIAYTLATTALYFVSPPAVSPAVTSPSRTAVADARAAVDVNAILASDLFGRADAATVATVESAPTVATQLPLELLGVFVADASERSAAIVAQRGRPGLLYTVGDTVPGNATLVEVQSDHVVLRRAGVRESLNFPAPGTSLAARAAAASSFMEPIETYDEPYVDDADPSMTETLPEETIDRGDMPEPGASASAREVVESYRERLSDDPAETLQELGFAPVAEGAAQGYRVGNLAQSPYLSQTGLQPGDVILSVNGRPVGDLSQDRLELDNVLAEGSARLEVQRGTRRFFVTATLP